MPEPTNINPSTSPLAVNVKGVMRLTGLGERAVRDAIRAKQIKVIRAGRKIVVPMWSLEEFLRTSAA